MGVANKYWFFVGVDSFGNCLTQELKETFAFFVSQFPEVVDCVNVPHLNIQHLLMQWYQEDEQERQMAMSCLRCFISNQIKEICEQLEVKFGRKHDFTSAELLPLVLDSIQKSPRQQDNANTIEPSLTTRIIESFDPEKSNLSSWTSRMFKSDRLVKRFLLERGIEQVTDWMILSYTNSARLERVLSRFDRTKAEIDTARQLLNYYHRVYSAQLVQHRQIGSRNRYPDPTFEQLCQIADLYKDTRKISPEKVLEELQNLAKLLRTARISGKLPLPTSVETYSDSEEESQFLDSYRQQFDTCLALSVNQVIQARVLHLEGKKTEKALEKAKKYLKALHLFHCQGVSMKEIALQLGFTDQPHLSRFLELKNLRSDIGHNTLLCLRARVLKLGQFYLDADQLRNLEQKVQALLDEQINTVIKEAEKEASTGHKRVINGRLAQSICQYLNTKKEVL